MQFTSILTYGFAIFAMFFGSGNLVFPLQIGQMSGYYWLFGFFGLVLTGIVLPFCGLFVIKLHKGNYHSFFDGAGSYAKTLLPFFTLSLLGSFGVVPRCITVAYGSLSYVMPNLSLLAVSLIFCAATYLLCLRDQTMIEILGKWLSPILLISLVILIAMGVIMAPILGNTHTDLRLAFQIGFMTGYQTMDLFAAFFFSALIFTQIKQALPNGASDREILRFAAMPSILGSLMLMAVYLGFVYLGAHYSEFIKNTEPERMLPTIVKNTMGLSATAVIATTIIFSCLTTAIALNNIYARYLCATFHIKNERFPIVLFCTTCASFILSLLDFRGIATMLVPILKISYPGLISLTMVSIFCPKAKTTKKCLFWGITIAMTVMSLAGI